MSLVSYHQELCLPLWALWVHFLPHLTPPLPLDSYYKLGGVGYTFSNPRGLGVWEACGREKKEVRFRVLPTPLQQADPGGDLAFRPVP